MKKIGVLLTALSLAVTVSSCDKLKALFSKEKVEEPGNVLILTDIPQRLLNVVSSDDNEYYAIQIVLYERVEKDLISAIYGIVDTYDEENKAFHFNLLESEGEDAQAWRGTGEYYVAAKFLENGRNETFSYSRNPVKDAYIMGYTERYWADMEEIKFNKVSFDEQTTSVSFASFDDVDYGVYD